MISLSEWYFLFSLKAGSNFSQEHFQNTPFLQTQALIANQGQILHFTKGGGGNKQKLFPTAVPKGTVSQEIFFMHFMDVVF